MPKLPERKPESLGFDKPSFVYDHSDDQAERDTILLNYCIDDIEAMCRVRQRHCHLDKFDVNFGSRSFGSPGLLQLAPQGA